MLYMMNVNRPGLCWQNGFILNMRNPLDDMSYRRVWSKRW